MKNSRNILILVLLQFCIIISSFARESTLAPGIRNATPANQKSLAAGCAPPSASTELALNNVRATIHSGADMWWDLIGNARYEVPKGSNKNALFSGSLWMGGLDINQQLKLAAIRFRQDGNDFWPGPLTKDGTASIDPATCALYNRHFAISRQEVDEFAGWFALKDNPVAQNDLYPGYVIPQSILNWPAHGDVTLQQDYYLAPFFDADGSGDYNPEEGGDYPKYDITNSIDCKTSREAKLYGDKTLWWVFNDKGNIHTETGAASIGMEVRAQAFAFATNDEINNMTFYNYELINRSTFTLTQTYFGQFVDPDLGYHLDDYVGCDVKRGLGYCYNGAAVDGSGGPGHYGANPPAIGVDFFEGPFQDNDNMDNPGPNEANGNFLAYGDAVAGNGIVYSGMGIGYGDGIVDNERFGMRRFVYFNNAPQGHPSTQDPHTGSEHYNLLRGIWKDNNSMVYGGSGHPSDPSANSSVPALYMFPGDSDPQGWGTGGSPQPYWSEETAGNLPADRRFIQSAGPFTLEPGAVNNITVGVVWARAIAGGAFASVEKLRLVDDKAQALFDNCFRVLNGPDAPDLAIIELDRELILHISNRPNSNNANEQYSELDPIIRIAYPDSLSYYKFQGYQIFQVKDATVSAEDLRNPDKARLVGQCDIKDGVMQLVNFEYSDALNANIPTEEVNGSDKGIRHTFQILNDEFATDNKRLVNHKTYHFMAIAYGYNQYKKYDQNDPLQLDGQKKPYKASRKSASGAIRVSSAIPHKVQPEAGGLAQNSIYGQGPKLKRMEGTGNGSIFLDFTTETVNGILSSSSHKVENPVYEKTAGPVNIRVFDPKNVPNANFTFKLLDTITPGDLSDATWSLKNETTGETVLSERTIKIGNEQLINRWGLAVTVQQSFNPGADVVNGNGAIDATIEYSDNRKIWLWGVPDADGASPFNWIRSGTAYQIPQANVDPFNDVFYTSGGDRVYLDPNQFYERLLGGTWAPYRLTSTEANGPAWKNAIVMGSPTDFRANKLSNLASVDVIITSDQSKWTRCPIIETGEDSVPLVGGAKKFDLRRSPSVGKDGLPDGSGTMGMGWFPGYALNLETGERLNMMFGEDSWLAGQNGRDMKWNPTSEMMDNANVYFGGKHFIYVMGHNGSDLSKDGPNYDEGKWLFDRLSSNNYVPDATSKRNVYKDVMWVSIPFLIPNTSFMSSDVKVRLRVSKAYKSEIAAGVTVANPENNNLPMYTFSTGDLQTVRNDLPTAKDALKLINIVPNPYYAYSAYEVNQLDNRVKITNLPDKCQISIYSVNGNLIRKFNKADPKTSLDWDLKNLAGIPIASGIYLIHVNVEGVGERVIKWFGAMRPIDLDSF